MACTHKRHSQHIHRAWAKLCVLALALGVFSLGAASAPAIVYPAAPEDLNSAFLRAARAGDLASVSRLLDKGADINARDTGRFFRSDTALHHAARRNDVELAKLLVGRGADPNVQGSTGYTPLHVAAGLGREKMVAWLLRHGANPSAVDRRRGMPLHAAVLQGQPRVVQLLIEAGADVNAPGNGEQADTPLHILFVAGTIRPEHEAIARMLIKAGADLMKTNRGGTPAYWPVARTFPALALELAQQGYALDYSKPSICPLLFYLAYPEQLPTLRYLLEHGQSTDARDSEGRTLLHFAASIGHAPTIEYLLKRRMDVNARAHNGMTPLHVAARSNREAAVDLLLSDEANPRLRDSHGNTPLHLTYPWQLNIMSALVAHGGDLNARNDEGWNVLDRALKQGGRNLPKTVKFILDHGGDAKSRDPEGLTAMHRVQVAAVVDLLVAAGGDVNARSNDGRVPLDFARNRGVVEALIARGADPKARDDNGATPLHYAAVYLTRDGAAAALVRHGADVNAVAKDGGTPLLWLARKWPCAEVPNLISLGADARARMPDGRTALHLIAAQSDRRGYERCFAIAIDALLKAGLDPAIKDNQGRTAYDVAVSSGNSFVAERLK